MYPLSTIRSLSRTQFFLMGIRGHLSPKKYPDRTIRSFRPSYSVDR